MTKANIKEGITCQVTTYYVEEGAGDGARCALPWLAIASAHTYDPDPDTGGVLTPQAAIIAGAVMRTFHGRAAAPTREKAMKAAVVSLLGHIEGSGLLEPDPEDDDSGF